MRTPGRLTSAAPWGRYETRGQEGFNGACHYRGPTVGRRVGQAAMIVAVLPLRIVSILNRREHWAVRAKRAKSQRMTAYYGMLKARAEPPPAPLRICLTRVYSRHSKPMDHDNLIAGFKSVRDGIADWLQVDDGDGRLEWRYAERGGKEHWSVEVNVMPQTPEEGFRWVPGGAYDAPITASLPGRRITEGKRDGNDMEVVAEWIP
jgi:hypothetical protein